MTGFDDSYEAAEFGAEADDSFAVLHRISAAQEELGRQLDEVLAGLQSVAGHLNPLLADQYKKTQDRIRALEVMIRNRQERPLINRLFGLLADVRRLHSATDIKTHVEEALLDALTAFGYEETGSVGEPYDPGRHEPAEGSMGRAGVVTRVHQRGLACSGDVIKKALVDVAPGPDQSPVPAAADPGETAACVAATGQGAGLAAANRGDGPQPGTDQGEIPV
jgi:molecular chaperone GrpE (heat shock protein)